MLKYDCEYTYLISVFEIIVYGFFQGVSNDSLILPETLFIDRLFQILVGGGDDADVETAVGLVANGTEPPFLYGTE